MMLATARLAAIRAPTATAPRTAVALGGRRFLALQDTLKGKESVEEERYIRKMEHNAYLRRKAKEDAHAAEMEKNAEDTEFKSDSDAAIEELFGILAGTGDKISDMGIEKIAKWKLGKD
eukprot:CAMPEP_0113555882 /NCGR_PEP_ID=MMETSP0015_2-20120614/16957_1 /TAXON_ID=2838 /ORGANISM="Odontella" /LENGTH=118 /DNA_ID=CAMNT_0000457195 /DNA_START=57 /DNA_END=413 /DNA_ORIENTATION=+ /assembly_acc=CAM_ASM_000160